MILDPRSASNLPMPLRSHYDSRQVELDCAVLAGFPARLAKLVDGVSADRLGSTYRQGGWTVAEIVHHLVDSHLHSYLRCKFALCQNHPAIMPYEENDWVRTGECGAEEVVCALGLLANLHQRWSKMLRSLDEGGWTRTFHHPQSRRDFALYQQVAIYAWHGDHHMAQAAQALGKELPA